jgi:tape measure domain-containing protein
VATTTNVVITGDSSGLVNAVNAAVAALGKINTSATTATKSLDTITATGTKIQNSLGAIKLDSIINLGQRALSSASAIVRLGDAVTTVMNKMASLTNNSADAGTAFNRVADISRKTGVQLEVVASSIQKYGLAAKLMGYNLEDAAIVTETLSKALAVTGTSGPAAESALYNIGQALGTVTVRYEEMNQLRESSSQMFEMIANQFGKTGPQFMAMVQQNMVGSRDLMQALIDLKQQSADSFGSLTPTVGMALNNVRTNFMKLLNDMEAKYGIFSKLADAILKLSDNLTIVIPLVVALGTAWAVAKVASWGIMLFEAAAGATALAIGMGRVAAATAIGGASAGAGAAGALGIAGMSKNLLGIIKRLGPIGIAAYAAYEAYNLIADKLSVPGSPNTGTDLSGVGNKKTPITGAATVVRGAPIDLATLELQYITFAKTYSVSAALVGLNDRRVEQEQAVLKFADETRNEYGRLVAEQGAFVQKLRDTVALEQQRKDIAEARKATPTGINEEAGIKIQNVQVAANAALRANDIVLAQQYNDQILLMEMTRADQIIALQNKVFENQQLKRIQETTGSMFGYDTQKAMAAEAANFEKKSASEKTQFALGEAATALTAMGQQNKQAFEASKAFNIANAIMNTYMGVTKTLATYPFPLNIALGALALGAGMAQVAAIRSQTYSGRALGGPVQSGTPYMVGERGPELFTPSSSGNITRNDQLGGGGPMNINFNIQANDAQGFDDLLIKRRGMIQQFVRDAMTDNGQRSKM